MKQSLLQPTYLPGNPKNIRTRCQTYLLALLLSSSPVCAQVWTQRSDLPDKRYNAVSFCIDDKIYVAGGEWGSTWPTTTRTDLLEYDIATDTWVQRSTLPGTDPGCSNGIGFAINGKGYIGLGFGTGNAKSELWEYDPVTNTWDQMSGLPSGGRYGTACFVVNNKAYVVGGFESGMISTVWEFDPATNTWTSKAGFQGGATGDLEGFAANNKGYILGGDTPNGVTKALYQYDPATNQWSRKANFPGTARQGHMVFVLNNTAYCSGGAGGVFPPNFSPTYNDIYSYDVITNTWTQEDDFPGPARCLGFACSTGSKAYIGSGLDNGITNSIWYQDLYEFTPPAVATAIRSADKDLNRCTIFPNPSGGTFYVSGMDLKSLTTYKVITPEGRTVLEGKVTDNGSLKMDGISAGMYVLQLSAHEEVLRQVILVE